MQTSTEVHFWHTQTQLPSLLFHQQDPSRFTPSKTPQELYSLALLQGRLEERRHGIENPQTTDPQKGKLHLKSLYL